MSEGGSRYSPVKFCKKHWVPELLAGIGFGKLETRCNGSASWLALAFFAYILIGKQPERFFSCPFRCVQLPPFSDAPQ